MKTIKLFIAVLMTALFVQNNVAKGMSTGLYLTLDDYVNHKLSFAADMDKIKLNEFLGEKNIVVVHDGKKQAFTKSQVFGYRSGDVDYRFFNNTAYKIIDTKGFIIYSHPKSVQQGKGMKPVETYYFGTAAADVIQPLTIMNLKVAFVKNTKFRYMIEGQFKSDNELASYDPSIKEFKIKYLYDESNK